MKISLSGRRRCRSHHRLPADGQTGYRRRATLLSQSHVRRPGVGDINDTFLVGLAT